MLLLFTAPGLLLAIALVIPYGQLSPKQRFVGLVILSCLVIYGVLRHIFILVMTQLFVTSSTATSLLAFFCIGSSVILLAQPVAIYFIHRRPPASLPP